MKSKALRSLSSLLLSTTSILALSACGSETKSTNDSSTGDAGSDSAVTDSGSFTAFGNCQNASQYENGTAITINNSTFRYAPMCLRVARGATVSVEVSATHPLKQGTGGTEGNPFPAATVEANATVSFPNPGFYPYFCVNHGTAAGQGMAGVVWVQ